MELGKQVLDNSCLAREDLLNDHEVVRAMPQSVYMDISNRCNIRCIMCPYHWNGQDQRKADIMPKEVFLRIGRELFPTARNVYLYGGGEVFLHPDWDEMFDFARAFTFLPIVSTHGMLLNDRRIEALVEAGLQLRISFDGAKPETFNEIRHGADFDRVVANIRRLVEYRDQHAPGGRFLLRFSVTSFDRNIREAPLIVELASELGVEQVVFHHLMVDRNPLAGHELKYSPELADEMFCQAAEKGAELGVHVQVPEPFDYSPTAARRTAATARVPPNRHAPYFDYPLGPETSYTCRVPWVESYVKTDGKVRPCCMIAQEFVLGDLLDNTFQSVWNNPDYQKFRRDVNSREPPCTCSTEACVYRIHQVDQGRLRLDGEGRVQLDSRCPGKLRASIHPLAVHFQESRLNAQLAVANTGDTLWLADAPERDVLGCVRLGVKTLDAAGALLADFSRVTLDRDLSPGETTTLMLDVELPPGAAAFQLDMVAEMISWFEPLGSPTLTLAPKDAEPNPVLSEWDVDLSRPGWRRRLAVSDATVEETAAGLRVRTAGADPRVVLPRTTVDLAQTRTLRVTADFLGHCGHELKVYFATEDFPCFDETNTAALRVPCDSGPIALCFDFSRHAHWRGQRLQLRFDLEEFPIEGSAVVLQRLELLPWPVGLIDLALPPVAPEAGEDFHLRGRLRAHGCAIEDFSCSSGLRLLASPHPARCRGLDAASVWRLGARRPGIQRVTLGIDGDDERYVAELWVRDGELPRLPSSRGGAGVRFVPEVSITLVRGGRLRRLSLPLTPDTDPGSGVFRASRDIAEGRCSVTFSVEEDEDGLAWCCDLEVPSTALVTDLCLPRFLIGEADPLAASDLVLLPGIEMRSDGLPLSADSACPAPWKVTWPCVYIEQNGSCHAVSWADSELTPDLGRGAGDTACHVLALHWPERPPGRAFAMPRTLPEGRWRISGGIHLGTDRVDLLTRLGRGLARPARRRRDEDAILERSATSLVTTFHGREWLTRHRLAGDAEHEYFDPRVAAALLVASRLGLVDLEAAARRQVERFLCDNDDLALSLGLLLPEQLERAVGALESRADRLRATQRADGTWPASGVPGCLAPDPEIHARTAAAVARPASCLLQAHLLGSDESEPIERALARLRQRHLLPTGGQAWEFSPGVPDLLAVGELVEIFLLSAEAGLGGLDRALSWLMLGTTFFRLRNGHESRPAFDFACVPALGITRDDRDGLLWYQHAPDDQRDWRGLSCPWVGLRFAEAIEASREKLARTGGGSPELHQLLARLSDAVLRHAAELQRADGSLPDGFIGHRRRPTEPLYLAPVDLVTHALARRGAPPRVVFARHGGVTAAGVGRFRCSGRALIFHPSAPGRQMLLLRGAATVLENERRPARVTLGPALTAAELAGTGTTRIESQN